MKCEFGQIVRGVQAGIFRVRREREVDGKPGVQLIEIDPFAFTDESRAGEIWLPKDAIRPFIPRYETVRKAEDGDHVQQFDNMEQALLHVRRQVGFNPTEDRKVNGCWYDHDVPVYIRTLNRQRLQIEEGVPYVMPDEASHTITFELSLDEYNTDRITALRITLQQGYLVTDICEFQSAKAMARWVDREYNMLIGFKEFRIPRGFE